MHLRSILHRLRVGFSLELGACGLGDKNVLWIAFYALKGEPTHLIMKQYTQLSKAADSSESQTQQGQHRYTASCRGC